jgi:steroid delta-isomerase-like uncharacterized protein
MSQSYRTVADQWAELWSAGGDLTIADRLVASDFVSHGAPPGLPPGPEGVKQWVGLFRSAFPDLWSTVDDVITDGDKVVERFRGGGTHRGSFFGIPPTGKAVATTGINIFRIAEGKIVEHWGNSDDLGLLRQLGVVPSA